MILTLDVGNSQIYGGVFDGDKIKVRFRKISKTGASSDELGLFLKSVLRENGVEPSSIHQVAICSVVPDIVHSLKNCCQKYFKINPFILQAGAKTGLKIKYKNPLELGADRIANAIGATHLYPGKNLIVIDFGTATTFCAINRDKEYLGGLIMPGLRLSMEALESKTSRLPAVEIIAPREVVGRSTVENIQAGLYFGHLAMIKDISHRIKTDYLCDKAAMVIGTGGFSRLFEKEKVFDAHLPDLILIGMQLALKMNTLGVKHENHYAEIKNSSRDRYGRGLEL